MKAGSGHCCIYSRRIAVLILLLVLPLFLSAAPYRVAVVSESASYRDIIMDALSILSGDITSGEAIEERRERDERKRTLERERELSELRQAESFDRIESFLDGADVQEDDDGLVLEISDAAFSQTEMEYLCRGDMDAFRYLLLRHDLDLIIAVSTEEDGLMTAVDVWINGEEVHRNLYISSSDDGEFSTMLSILRPMLKGPDTVLVSSSLPRTVTVLIDGEQVTPVRGLIAMERGEHAVSLSSPFYQSVEMSFTAEDGAVLSAHFTPVFSGAIFISSVPYDSSIYYQGQLLDTHTVTEGSVPFQITATHPGFSPRTIQSRIAMDRIQVSLRPAWMEDEDIVERAKTRFYDNLLTTLISFGGYVASGAVERILPDQDLAPVTAMMAGFSFVQLVELMDSMFDYFQAARLGI